MSEPMDPFLAFPESLPYRPGAMGALMDEYERALREFSLTFWRLPQLSFEQVRDPDTTDEDCRSIQTIVRHVVRSGYGYAGHMRTALGTPFEKPSLPVETPEEGVRHLALVAACTAETFAGRWQLDDAVNQAIRIQSHWGPVFNLEQMFEHAIVHVLRHRRQIERFLGMAGR